MNQIFQETTNSFESTFFCILLLETTTKPKRLYQVHLPHEKIEENKGNQIIGQTDTVALRV